MIIWAFPGMGKTEFSKKNTQYEDADVRKFMFTGIEKEKNLHGSYIPCERDTSFPENYLSYIKQFEHDANRHVLINCNLALCRYFDDVLFVYPDKKLKEVMVERYKSRNDQADFVEYMKDTYNEMIDDLNYYPTTKKIVVEKGVYLSELKGEIESMLMTKNDLVALINEGIKYGVFKFENNTLTCDETACLSEPVTGVGTAEEIAQALFDGKAYLSTDLLKKVVGLKKEGLKREAQREMNRQGFTREEIEALLIDAMVYGVATPYYGEVAPYTHGYELRYNEAKGDNKVYTVHGFFELPLILAWRIEDGAYRLDLWKLQEQVRAAEKENNELKTYETAAELGWSFDGWDRHIHSIKDVHALKGLDAIVRGKCFGTWSNCMASNQNALIEQMVLFKGYCLDYLLSVGRAASIRDEHFVIALQEYHARHGLDISTPEKIREWAERNPDATLARATNENNRIRGKAR